MPTAAASPTEPTHHGPALAAASPLPRARFRKFCSMLHPRANCSTGNTTQVDMGFGRGAGTGGARRKENLTGALAPAREGKLLVLPLRGMRRDRKPKRRIGRSGAVASATTGVSA